MPKIVRIGNSLGVTLPQEQLKALGLQQGDEVLIQRRGSLLELVPVERRPRLRPELQAAVDATLAQFDGALRRLAE